MSGGGSSTDTNQVTERGAAQASESIGAGQSIIQSLLATDLGRAGGVDPRIRLATMDKQREELTSQMALAQQRYDENQSALGRNPQARGNMDAYFMQMSGLRQQLADLDASKALLTEQAGTTQQGVDVAKQFLSKLSSGLTTGDFVDPAERAAMTTAASGLSQDVATTRGLNRTDVPVMQAIAPTLASMWLQQQNTNKAFYTGAYQANQGLGLQQNQMNLSTTNPGLGLASVYSSLRGSNVTGTSDTQNRPGGMDYAKGIISGIQGLGAAGASAYGAPGINGGGGFMR